MIPVYAVDTRQLLWDVTDNIYDRLGGISGMDDDLLNWLIEHIEEPVQRLICQAQGHVIVDDQCDRPEHRYCVTCGLQTPNEPVSS